MLPLRVRKNSITAKTMALRARHRTTHGIDQAGKPKTDSPTETPPQRRLSSAVARIGLHDRPRDSNAALSRKMEDPSLRVFLSRWLLTGCKCYLYSMEVLRSGLKDRKSIRLNYSHVSIS